MDVKEGDPAAVFHWFFDSGQGTDDLAQFLIILYGSCAAMTELAKNCVSRQSEFDEALGPEVLFLFFDPNVTQRDQAAAGRVAAKHLPKISPATFLYGKGAYAVPPGMVEVGRQRFRSEDPDSCYFSELSTAIAKAHGKAIPFFQQAFELEPGQNALIFAHRAQRTLRVYDLGHEVSVGSEDLLSLTRAMRPVARHSKGATDLAAVDMMVTSHLNRALMKRSAWLVWKSAGRLVRRTLSHDQEDQKSI